VNAYEALYIITPELEDEATRLASRSIPTSLRPMAAKWRRSTSGAKTRLAYPLSDYKTEGYYVLMTFQSAPEVPQRARA
jgi:ribosomal protein S6